MFRTLFVAVAFAGLAIGCGQADTAVDCENICSRFDDCAPRIDKDQCLDRCHDTNDDMGFDTKADECDSCLDANDNSCIDSATSCASECAFLL
jgi:hypothetical protein